MNREKERIKLSCEIHGSHTITAEKDKSGETHYVRSPDGSCERIVIFRRGGSNNGVDLDKMLEACVNTPPITLKQIKEELKKEREEKKQSSENK